jgi:ABC-2 type transport system permease protein
MQEGRRAPSPALGLFLDVCQRHLYIGVGYLIVWLFWLVPLALRIAGPTPPADPAHELAQSGMDVVVLSAVVSFAMVCGAFSWMYDRRAVQLYGMIPLRRRSTFLAVALAGVIPLLVAVGIAGLVFSAALGFRQDAAAILSWTAGHALLIVTFSGIAALCVQLAGRPVFALLCYLLVNFYAYAARQFAGALCSLVAPSVLLASVAWLDRASPLVRLLQLVTSWTSTYPFPDPGCGAALTQAVVVYAAVGVACAAAAGLAFSRRNLERAGDAYVIPAVRTAISALVSILAGFAAAELVLSWSLSYRNGTPARMVAVLYGVSPQLACLLPVVFSALVFAVIEAIMGHGVKALRKRVPALVTTTSVALVASIACVGSAADAAAYVPNPVDVQRATVSSISIPFEGEENITRVIQLHSLLAASSNVGDEPVPSNIYSEIISYQMKDGTSISRQYAIPLNGDGEPSTGSKAAQALMDFANDPATEEALRSQVDAVLLDAGSSSVTIAYEEYAPDSQEDAPWRSGEILPADYAAFRNALNQDIDEHGAACAMPLYQLTTSLYDSAGTYQYLTTTNSSLGAAADTPYLASVSLSLTVPGEDSADTTIYLSEGATPHTVAWLRFRFGYEFVAR